MRRIFTTALLVRIVIQLLVLVLVVLVLRSCAPEPAQVTTISQQTDQPKTHLFDQNEIGPGRPEGPTALNVQQGDDLVIYVCEESLVPGIADECHISEIITTDSNPSDVLVLDRTSIGKHPEPGKTILYRLIAVRSGTADIILGSISEPSVTIKVTVK